MTTQQPRTLRSRTSYDEAKPAIKELMETMSRNREPGAPLMLPTAGALLAVLGRGSKSTMQAYIDRYEKDEIPRRVPHELSMPPEAQKFYLDTLDRQVRKATALSETKISELEGQKAFVIAEAQDFERRLEEEQNLTESLRTELSEKNGAIRELQSSRQKAIDDVQKAANEMNVIRQQLDVLRGELAKAQLLLEGIPRLEETISSLRAELKAETNARIEAEKTQAIAQAVVKELSGYRAKAEKLMADLRDESVARMNAEKDKAGATARANELAGYKEEAERLRGDLRKETEARTNAEKARAIAEARIEK